MAPGIRDPGTRTTLHGVTVNLELWTGFLDNLVSSRRSAVMKFFFNLYKFVGQTFTGSWSGDWNSKFIQQWIENGVFEKFTALRELYLEGNALQNIDEMVLTESLSQNLEILILSRNELERLSNSTFGFLKHLTTLDLSGNGGLQLGFWFPSTLKSLDWRHFRASASVPALVNKESETEIRDEIKPEI